VVKNTHHRYAEHVDAPFCPPNDWRDFFTVKVKRTCYEKPYHTHFLCLPDVCHDKL
jgi:hypothetical protein